MFVRIFPCEHSCQKTCEDIVRLFYPLVQFTTTDCFDLGLQINYSWEETSDLLHAEGLARHAGEIIAEQKRSEQAVAVGEKKNQAKRLANLVLFRLLQEISKSNAALPEEIRRVRRTERPWGILTGVRPTKIVHRLLDADWSSAQISHYLQQNYAVAAAKASLLLEVANRQRRYLLQPHQVGERVSIYIGIPFCPTRCAYCSFSGYPLAIWENKVADYLTVLGQEIAAVSSFLRQNQIKVDNIYIGGGTPTSLTAEQLQRLLLTVGNHFSSAELKEYTVEAGRPDTITRTKLQVLKQNGVNRISINPQTMDERTLQLIGRRHTPEDILRAYALAREVGFASINMDVILGLPQETVQTVANTLQCLLLLAPENITVHTLALKRASLLNQNRNEFILPDDNEAAAMADRADYLLRSGGLQPYYLYRQKQMLGCLENTGYARADCESVYNIQMMEERQTIIGLGAGAGSKFVNPSDWTLESFYNTKDPGDYINRGVVLAELKIAELRRLLERRV